MKSLDEQMAIYAAYHRNQWNKLTHFVGVPAIVFAILIPMSWVPLGAGVTLAHVFLGVVLAYYLLLDFPLGLATGVMSFALLYTGPALADNLFQIFVAPIFLVAEVFFALGLKRDVLKKVEARLAEMSPAK